MDFQTVMFSDEVKVTFDEPDGGPKFGGLLELLPLAGFVANREVEPSCFGPGQ